MKSRLRRLAFQREGGRCFWCDAEVLLLSGRPGHLALPPNAATLDHITPVSRGGERHSLENVVCACLACNQARGTTPAVDFLFVVRRGAQF
jgi:5-methylcytosine-specific restriction endonuclease McrA